MVAIARIKEFVDQIALQFEPQQVILFGSHASGRADSDSDVDLLVVLQHSDKNWRTAARIRTAIPAPFPLDLLVRQPDEMNRRLIAGDVLLKEISETGRILYESLHA